MLFNKVVNSNMSITNFRTSLVEQLIKKKTIFINPPTIKHQLEKTGKSRCFICYSVMSSEKGRKYAQSHSLKVQTKCLACNKYYCIQCFIKDHKITK